MASFEELLEQATLEPEYAYLREDPRGSLACWHKAFELFCWVLFQRFIMEVYAVIDSSSFGLFKFYPVLIWIPSERLSCPVWAMDAGVGSHGGEVF